MSPLRFAVGTPDGLSFKGLAAPVGDGRWSCTLTSYDFDPIRKRGCCVVAVADTDRGALDHAIAKARSARP